MDQRCANNLQSLVLSLGAFLLIITGTISFAFMSPYMNDSGHLVVNFWSIFGVSCLAGCIYFGGKSITNSYIGKPVQYNEQAVAGAIGLISTVSSVVHVAVWGLI